MNDQLILYASFGSKLTRYRVNTVFFTLELLGETPSLPADVQFACSDKAGRYLFVVSSDGAPGSPGKAHFVSAFAIDQVTGQLIPRRQSKPLPARPIHISLDSNDQHMLIAYTELSTVTVFEVLEDGYLGGQIEQPNSLDTGAFAHEIFVRPSGQGVLVVARGNDAGAEKPEEPGGIRAFKYHRGALQNWYDIAPNQGFGFGPRNVAEDSSYKRLYASLERQNKLCVFKLLGNHISAEPLFEVTTLFEPEKVRPRQLAGALQLHPCGPFLYVANRAFGVEVIDGQQFHTGGENSIAVYRVDDLSRPPLLVQSVDTQGIYPRTFSIDPSGRMLIVGNIRRVSIRQAGVTVTVPANLAVFSIDDSGMLTFRRRYEVCHSAYDLFWTGLIPLRKHSDSVARLE